MFCLQLIIPLCSVSLLEFRDLKMRKTISIWMIAEITLKGVSYRDLLILPSKCYHFTQNWVLFGLIYLKIKLIYNQFSPHLNSDLQVFLQGSSRIREIMCCLSCSLEQNPSQTRAYGAGCFRDHANTFTLLYIFLLILNLYLLLARNLKNKQNQQDTANLMAAEIIFSFLLKCKHWKCKMC